MRFSWRDRRHDRTVDPLLEDSWRLHYQRIAPPIVGYLAAQGLARPADLVVPLLLQAVRKIEALHADHGGLRVWAMFLAHRMVTKARGRHPSPVLHPDLVADLTDPERNVLLLRVFGGLSLEQVAATVRERRPVVAELERRALHRLRDRVGTGVYGLLGPASDISDEDAATLIAGDGFPSDPGLGTLASALEDLRTRYIVAAPTHIEDQHIAQITEERSGALALSL